MHTAPEALLWNGQSWTGQPIAGCGVGNLCEPRSVYMLSGGTGGDGWAVGLNGEIWRHQSGSWTLFSQPTLNNLNGVFINNPGASAGTPAGWAVGNSGTVLVLTITGGVPVWTPHAIAAAGTNNLNGVYFKDSTHGWIVGASSTILQTTDGGNSWAGGTGQVTGIASANLTSVFVDTFGTGSGNGDGWAVGDDGTGPPGNVVFAHWDGVTWINTPLTPPILAGSVTPGMSLRSVFLTGPEDGWTVGRSVTGGSLSGIIHLDPLNPPISGSGATTTIVVTSGTSTIVLTSGTFTFTSTSASTTTTSTSTSVTTESTTSTSSSTSTATTTSTSTEISTTFSSNTLNVPGIPGFPWESILAGIFVGLVAVGVIRRARKK